MKFELIKKLLIPTFGRGWMMKISIVKGHLLN